MDSTESVFSYGKTVDSSIVVERIDWPLPKTGQLLEWAPVIPLEDAAFQYQDQPVDAYINASVAKLEEFGIHVKGPCGESWRIYCRDEVQTLHKFLEATLTKKQSCWIYGPSDSGKSTAAALFVLCRMDWSEQDITWIHLDQPAVTVVRINKYQQVKLTFSDDNIAVFDSLFTTLDTSGDST